MKTLNIGIIGDYDQTFPPHVHTDSALAHAAAELELKVEATWLATDQTHQLKSFDGLWCAPGSPYRSLAGALRCVQFAREEGTPLLGTCGGFQHMVLEFARNVLRIEDAAHAEYDPYASHLFIEPLSCSLKGRTMAVEIEPNSLAARCYGRLNVEESYYCNFGLNPKYQEQLHKAGFVVTGWDGQKEARILELPAHPFYVATLFVPQAQLMPYVPHPVIKAFVRAASSVKGLAVYS